MGRLAKVGYNKLLTRLVWIGPCHGHHYISPWQRIGASLNAPGIRIDPVFPQSLRRNIVLLICIKAAVLTLMYYALIAPVARPEPDGRAMAAYLLNGRGN